MDPIWPVYLFIALILLADLLLVAGIILLVLFLVAYVAFNVFTGFVKLMLNKLVHDLLDYLKKYSEEKSKGKTSDYGKALVEVARWIYRVVFWLYNIFQLGIDVAICLAAVALIVLGVFTLWVINLVLAWLVYAYIL
ncbi:MAG: hypothetical protein A4E28_01229 [Methanocella sp. PtaU1.Bin125]|nr:MAG: hypothetical protein A4E28_01229 [Methanocella sp. PtaU1.Bin125]